MNQTLKKVNRVLKAGERGDVVGWRGIARGKYRTLWGNSEQSGVAGANTCRWRNWTEVDRIVL